MPTAPGNPLLRIRAGIEAGNANEVQAGVAEARSSGTPIAQNVQDMITQWLAVHAPSAPPPFAPQPAAAFGATGAGENIQVGGGKTNWMTADRGDEASARPLVEPPVKPKRQRPGPEFLRTALLKFFEGAPKGSDEALGLAIKEGDDGARYLKLPHLGRAVGLGDLDEDTMTEMVLASIREAPKGVFVLSGYGVGLCEWAGWDEFKQALKEIVSATQDPAFEPSAIAYYVLRTSRGAVRSGHVRQAEVIRMLQDCLSPQVQLEDAAPALRSAISRRARLALACVADGIAFQGLGPEAGPDSMGLVGQLPRSLFGHVFDNVDDRDRGACAFLGEVLTSWDRRRCFSKRWLQDAAAKFNAPKGVNAERDEGRGWYGLTAEQLAKTPPTDPKLAEPKDQEPPPKPSKDVEMAEELRGGDEGAKEVESQKKGTENESPRKNNSGDAKKADNEKNVSGGGENKDGKDGTAKKKRRIVQNEEEDDDEVAKKLEESRKRRAALLAKHGGD